MTMHLPHVYCVSSIFQVLMCLLNAYSGGGGFQCDFHKLKDATNIIEIWTFVRKIKSLELNPSLSFYARSGPLQLGVVLVYSIFSPNRPLCSTIHTSNTFKYNMLFYLTKNAPPMDLIWLVQVVHICLFVYLCAGFASCMQ